MGLRIKEAEAQGQSDAQARRDRKMAQKAAHEAFLREQVDEEAVRKFLDPLQSPMLQVKAELEENGYVVKDKGYGYHKISYSDQDTYALVHKGHYPEAYGQAWNITTPGGDELDTLCLFPSVNEATHFSKGAYSLRKGGQGFVYPTDDLNTATTMLHDLIGARIRAYVKEGHNI